MGDGPLTPLPRAFYARPVVEVARDLLGRLVVHGEVAIRLTEVEAYDGQHDPASHAFRGRTARNATMFGPPGHAYVYFTYGMHYCMNVVCGADGEASAVLLRAGEVLRGSETARRQRRLADRDLARGPARLTVALGVAREHDGADVTSGPLRVCRGHPVEDARVRCGPRVGVAAGADTPWRWWIDGERTVSAYRRA